MITKRAFSSWSLNIGIPFNKAPQTAPNRLCPAPSISIPVGVNERTFNAFCAGE